MAVNPSQGVSAILENTITQAYQWLRELHPRASGSRPERSRAVQTTARSLTEWDNGKYGLPAFSTILPSGRSAVMTMAKGKPLGYRETTMRSVHMARLKGRYSARGPSGWRLSARASSCTVKAEHEEHSKHALPRKQRAVPHRARQRRARSTRQRGLEKALQGALRVLRREPGDATTVAAHPASPSRRGNCSSSSPANMCIMETRAEPQDDDMHQTEE